MASEPDPIADTLRQTRDDVRDQVVPPRAAQDVLPPAPDPQTPQPVTPTTEPAAAPAPAHPDGGPVNSLWDVSAVMLPSGWRGRVSALLRRILTPWLERQAEFNSRQVQLDNQILEYLDARFEQTHRHYDSVLGIHGRHMQDIDQRHLELQREVVAHVHDLARRIDLVLAEGEANRIALEAALRDVRARLAALEQRLQGR